MTELLRRAAAREGHAAEQAADHAGQELSAIDHARVSMRHFPVSRSHGFGGYMRGIRLGLVCLAIIAAPAAVFGQWLRYPTADAPRKPDGTTNLTAPAPRLPDGKPDFSGLWHVAVRNPCNEALNRFTGCTEIGGSPLARDLGAQLPGGLPYQPWAAELTKQRTADHSRDDPHVRCLPDNPPRHWGLPHLNKLVHTPKLLVDRKSVV